MSRTWKMPRTWDRRATARTERQRAVGRNHWRALAERRALAGLTTRGTAPKRRLEGRLILAEIEALAASIAAVYEWLPAEGKARCLNLASKLGKIRKRLE